MCPQKWLFAVTVLPLMCAELLSSASQLNPCDPDLAAPEGNPYGYRMRGNRCEGIYVRQVSSSALLLASFTASIEDYDVGSPRDLLVEWSTPFTAEVRVQARALERRLYYRMDAILPAASAAFTWPAGLLGALSIQRQNLGVLAWSRMRLGSTEKNVTCPFESGKGRKGIRSPAITLPSSRDSSFPKFMSVSPARMKRAGQKLLFAMARRSGMVTTLRTRKSVSPFQVLDRLVFTIWKSAPR